MPSTYQYSRLQNARPMRKNKTHIGTRNFNFRRSSRSSTGRRVPRERKERPLQMSLLNVNDSLIRHYTAVSDRCDTCGRHFGRLAKLWGHQSVQVDRAPSTPESWCKCELSPMFTITYMWFPSSLRRVSSNNRTFFLTKCEISCRIFVASAISRLPKWRAHSSKNTDSGAVSPSFMLTMRSF